MKQQGKGYIGIREIAKLAGVSTATVSRVINNPDTTSLEAKNKVLPIIKEYNYIPNQAVKNIFSKTSNSLAIFIYDMENPFFISLIKEVNKVAFNNKYALLICDTENKIEKERDYLNYCESIRTAGIILTEGANYDLFLSSSHNQSIVFLDRTSNNKFPSVSSNNCSGVRMLVDYLYNLNHRKIAFVGDIDSFQSSRDRKKGFIQAMEAKGLTANQGYIVKTRDFTPQSGANAIDTLFALSELPTAVVCCNDQIARGAIMRANQLGFKVPEDLSVVGFDGISDFSHAKITTIRQDVPTIAHKLFDLVVNPSDNPSSHVIDVSMVRGETCRKIDLNA